MFPINFIFSLEAKFRKLNIYPMAQKYKRHIICQISLDEKYQYQLCAIAVIDGRIKNMIDVMNYYSQLKQL